MISKPAAGSRLAGGRHDDITPARASWFQRVSSGFDTVRGGPLDRQLQAPSARDSPLEVTTSRRAVRGMDMEKVGGSIAVPLN
jgi:hypothetical protein